MAPVHNLERADTSLKIMSSELIVHDFPPNEMVTVTWVAQATQQNRIQMMSFENLNIELSIIARFVIQRQMSGWMDGWTGMMGG